MALEYLERALKVKEETYGKTHPDTLRTVENITIVHDGWLKDYEKAEELYERALEGREAQLGKDHPDTFKCAYNYMFCLKVSGNRDRLIALKTIYPGTTI